VSVCAPAKGMKDAVEYYKKLQEQLQKMSRNWNAKIGN
jgi:hypothetical protein